MITTSKVKSIAEDLNLKESQVAMVLYDYLAYSCQEVLLDKETNSIFGKIVLNDQNELTLVPSKFGLIELLNKKDIKIIRKIVEDGPDYKIFEL